VRASPVIAGGLRCAGGRWPVSAQPGCQHVSPGFSRWRHHCHCHAAAVAIQRTRQTNRLFAPSSSG
jgi:hypothetical protein